MSANFSQKFKEAVLQVTGADGFGKVELIQTLWSGYGQILKVELTGCEVGSVILKNIQPPEEIRHPRGWNSQRSQERKLRSYQVEAHWYHSWSQRCDESCRVPKLYKVLQREEGSLLILEDLDEAGFPLRKERLSSNELKSCLKWLAEFHATFLQEEPTGLWETGTYWHFETRPDEFSALPEGSLKEAASIIDKRLSNARFQTFVHGDAKVANFCFSSTMNQVAAVDFQYVGRGCGVRDIAYFLGSCLSENELTEKAQAYLEDYLELLAVSIRWRRPRIDADAVVSEWRDLFDWAWADFERFLQGWSPGHRKLGGFSSDITSKVVKEVLESRER